jgi:hypothetical protein
LLVLKKLADSKKPNSDSVNAKVFVLPVIRCQCGEEILVLQDAQKMGKAIELHAINCSITKHSKNPSRCINKLSEHLIKKALTIAAKAEPEKGHSIKQPI